MFERRSSEFQYLEGYGQNSSVWNDEHKIPMFRIISKLQRVEGYGQNSNVWNDMFRIPMFKRKNKVRNAMFGMIWTQLQWLE